MFYRGKNYLLILIPWVVIVRLFNICCDLWGRFIGCWPFYLVGRGDTDRRQLGFRHSFPSVLWVILYLWWWKLEKVVLALQGISYSLWECCFIHFILILIIVCNINPQGILSGTCNFGKLAISTEALHYSHHAKIQLLLILVETLDLEILLQMVHDEMPFRFFP